MNPNALVRIWPLASWPLALVLTLVSTTSTRAQDDPMTVVHTKPTFELRFQGGTLNEYIAALREVAAEPNIVLDPAAEPVRLPPMVLKGVDVKVALDTVVDVVQGPAQVRISVNQSKPSAPVYVIRVHTPPPAPPEASAATYFVRVFPLGQLINPMPGDDAASGATPVPRWRPESILTAIEAGLDLCAVVHEGNPLKERKRPATIRYHEDSGLLFCRGTSEQLEMIDQVLANLEHLPVPQADPVTPPQRGKRTATGNEK